MTELIRGQRVKINPRDDAISYDDSMEFNLIFSNELAEVLDKIAPKKEAAT